MHANYQVGGGITTIDKTKFPENVGVTGRKTDLRGEPNFYQIDIPYCLPSHLAREKWMHCSTVISNILRRQVPPDISKNLIK